MSNEVKSLLFAGDAFVRFKDPATGTFGAPESLELDKFEIKVATERKEKLSKKRATFGQPFVSFGVPQPSEFSITFSEVSRKMFASMLAASMEALNIVSAAIAEDVTIANLDEWVPTGIRYINPTGFTVKDATETTTYVKDVDYQIDYELGHIRALSGGDISATDVVKLAGNTEAVTGHRLRGAQSYNQVLYIELNGQNLITRERVIITAPQASVATESAYDFMGGELADVPLTGRLEIASGWTEPFRIDYLNNAA